MDRVMGRETELADALARSEELSRLLAHSAHRFESLFYGLPVACVTMDLDGQVVEWNQAAEELYGYSAHEVLGKEITFMVPPQARVAMRKRFAAFAAAGGRRPSEEMELVRKDGESIWVLASTMPLMDSRNQLVGIIASSNDITQRKAAERRLVESNVLLEQHKRELEEANQKLETLALTDGLTGLYNRRAFLGSLHKAFAAAERSGRSASLILLDIDHFKAYNDEFGHPEGDAVLEAVAKLLTGNLRRSDFVARYGGEEFVVVLPDTPALHAMSVAEGIRSAIERGPWFNRQVTASLGVTSMSLDTSSGEELVEEADIALYKAKAAGRNQVRLWSAEQAA